MKYGILSSVFAACIAISIGASAQQEPRHRFVGIQADTGIPDGAALGLVLRPIPVESVDWFRLGVSGTYNGLAPGVRAGITFDPFRSPVAPTLTGEVGHAFSGTVPHATGSPTVQYDYANIHLGLEFGNRNVWRFFLRGGVSWMNVNTSNFQGALNLSDSSLMIGNPQFSGLIAPTGKLGFDYYF